MLLTHLVDNVIGAAYDDFHTHADAQNSAVSSYCAALGANNEATLKADAQSTWRAAMNSWQKIEMMQFGPLSRNESELRNAIYSWPLQNSCVVDQDVLKARSDSGFDVSSRQNQRKGLDALEHLLFVETTSNTCSTGIGVESWSSLSNQEIAAARCHLAELVAADIAISADSVVSTWTAEDSTENATYFKTVSDTDLHSAVNKITDAMFYFDTDTKSAKVAVPLGVKLNNCGDGVVCVENLESRLSANSLDNISNNIQALKMMFTGGEAASDIGFDDYLTEIGEAGTSTGMIEAINTTISSIDALDMTLEAALNDEDNKPKVEEIHSQMQTVSSLMKTEFMEKLNLELPSTAAGDGD